MVSQRSRERVKHVLSVSRVKLIYARITLTRYTTLYFFLALLSCIIFICLQTGTYLNNMEGTNAVAAFLVQSNVTSSTLGMSFLQDGNVVLCKNIPGQPEANCTTLVKRVSSHMHVRDTILSFDERADTPKNPQQCALSLMWLEDVLADASREDFGTLLYHIWLLTLSVVTLLNESLPHLFAGLAARALATAWAGFRVRGNSNLLETYYHVIDAGKCDGFDPLGTWWNQTTTHGILGLVANIVNLVIVAGLSYKLFRVYASQTFSRVGASTEVNHIYKLVLMLSVILQLSGFFTLGQAALWFSKISFGSIRRLADDFYLYLAELVVIAVLVGPWLTLGWISVRRESKSLFLLFSLISLILFGMSTALFTSPLNQFVFKEWSFYATMSVTAYILLVATFILAAICRLQFGKGLAHFLQVTDALEDGDFTPVYFSKKDDAASYIEDDTKSEFDPEKTILGLGYAYPKDEKEPQLPQPTHHHGRSLSVLPADTIKLSSTPAKLNIMTANRVSMSPIMVQPVSRSSSMKSNLSSSSPSRTKAPGLPSTVKPPAVPMLPPISVSPVSPKHARSETVDERPGRDRSTAAPAKPAQAVVRSTSVPRQGRPRRPSEAHKPGENFF